MYLKKAIRMGSSKYKSVGVVIPKRLADKLGIRPGDPLIIDTEDGKITIQKAKVTAE